MLILLHRQFGAQPDSGGASPADAGDCYEVHSAGTNPGIVRPEAVTVMRELGIDISGHRSKHVSEFDGQQFDYVITVCDSARENCPLSPGAGHRMHRGFEDPALRGAEIDRLALFCRVRDELRAYLREFTNAGPVGTGE